jgi:hypothetical protein
MPSVGFEPKISAGERPQALTYLRLQTHRLRWSRDSVLAFGFQVRWFVPGRSCRIFRAKKILSTPSFGGEVNPSVLCLALLAYLLTPWGRVLLEKLTGLQLVKKLPAFYGT